MRRIVDDKIYDTDKAAKIFNFERKYDASNTFGEGLYKTEKGNYFLAGKGGKDTKYADLAADIDELNNEGIIPLNYDGAKKWLEKYTTIDQYLTEFDAEEA